MDSLRRLAEKVRLPQLPKLTQWFAKPVRNNLSELVTIEFTEQGFAFAYLEHNGNQLKVAENVLCSERELAGELISKVNSHALYEKDCSWILTPDKYQIILLEELPVPANEFQQAIRYTIRPLLSFPIEDALIDFVALPAPIIPNAKKNMMVVVSNKKYIESNIVKIRGAGLNVVAIDVTDLAIKNIAVLIDDTETGLVFVYVQAKTTKILIISKKVLYQLRTIDWGYDLLAVPDSDTSGVIDKLALEIQRSFDYYQSLWRAATPNKIIVAVDKPIETNIADYINKRLDIDTKNLDLTERIQFNLNINTDYINSYLPLIGAALRTEINPHETTD